MNLLLGLMIMVLCLMLQAFLAVTVIHYYASRDHVVRTQSWFSTFAVIAVAMLMLVTGNLAQIAIWAVAFFSLDEFATFGEALYHSAVNFATLGYGDLVMSEARRILGPVEAINGALMIGVSTAVLMTALQDAIRKTAAARGTGKR